MFWNLCIIFLVYKQYTRIYAMYKKYIKEIYFIVLKKIYNILKHYEIGLKILYIFITIMKQFTL